MTKDPNLDCVGDRLATIHQGKTDCAIANSPETIQGDARPGGRLSRSLSLAQECAVRCPEDSTPNSR